MTFLRIFEENASVRVLLTGQRLELRMLLDFYFITLFKKRVFFPNPARVYF